MGREEQAKAERAELRRAVVDEALGRVSELEEKLASHKKIINRQGVAMEALANAITAFSRDVMALQAEARRPRGWRRVVAYIRGVAAEVREEQVLADRRAAVMARGSVTITRETAAPMTLEAPDPQAVERLEAALVPRPSHLHQYEKDGPFLYRCTVTGCGRRASMDEISAESAYLLKVAAGSTEH
jgi:uncharacterized coiled-coil protein SlyX